MSVKLGAFLSNGSGAPIDGALPQHTISHSWIGPLTASADFVALLILGGLSGGLYDLIAGTPYDGRRSYLGLGCIVAGLTVGLLKARGLYGRSSVLGENVIPLVVKIWLAVFSLLAVVAFLLGVSPDYSRGALLVYFAVGGVALIGIRRTARALLRKAIDDGSFKARRVILIADRGEISPADFAATLRCHGYSLARAIVLDLCRPNADPATLLPWSEITRMVRRGEADEIMVAVNWANVSFVEPIIDRLRILPVPLRLLPDRSASRLMRHPISDIGLTRTIDLQSAPLRPWELWVKGALDFIVATAALVLLSPLMLTVAILVKLDSPGPALFRQTRVGLNGSKFRIFKFRTMRTLDDDSDTIRQATRDDERVTRVGRWLRATSVDELPQLLNVLWGEMSIVGPRPHAVAHDTEYDGAIANYALRLRVKPGITGWAQVCGFRGETPNLDLMLKRIEHDLWYIHNWSFWLDSLIVFRTAGALMRPQNAY
jgi:Undecaprenyl-phosphate glucose phosphotransferase